MRSILGSAASGGPSLSGFQRIPVEGGQNSVPDFIERCAGARLAAAPPITMPVGGRLRAGRRVVACFDQDD